MKILEAPLVEKYVSKLIDDLCKNPQPFTGNRRNNIDYLNDLRNGIKRFKRLLRKAPAPLRTVLFSPEFARGLLATQGTTGDFNPNLRNYLSQREPARLTQLVGILDGLDARCEETARLALGTHAGANQLKRDAATASRDVIELLDHLLPRKEAIVLLLKDERVLQDCELVFRGRNRRGRERPSAPVQGGGAPLSAHEAIKFLTFARTTAARPWILVCSEFAHREGAHHVQR